SGPGANVLAVNGNANGRVFHISPGKTVTISGLTITNGAFNGPGGGIYNDHATLTVSNSTLVGNVAGVGAGIFNDGGLSGSATLTLNNSTFSGNSGSVAGTIVNDGAFSGSATLTIGDTVLKTGTFGANIFNNAGTVTSLGYNLSNDGGVTNVNGGTGDLNATGDQTNTDPQLGPLAYYGGPTATHILKAGSPAINKGKNLSGAT